MDVWFDSGASHLAVLTPENHLPWPSDMYLEGGDQYRGWFHSSLLDRRRPARRSALSRVGHQRLDARWRRPRALEIEGRGGSRESHQQIWRGAAAPVDRIGGFHRGRALLRHHRQPPDRGLPQAAQYVPLHAGQPARFRSGDGRGAGERAAGNRPLDSVARRGSGRGARASSTTRTRSTRCIARSTISRPRI